MSMPSGLFALPPGAPFAHRFAEGLFERLHDLTPAQMARTEIWVNTSLAGQSIEHALADTARIPGVLPRIVLMPDLHTDPLRTQDVPPAISPTRRVLRLTRLVEQFLTANRAAGETLGSGAMAADLAEELASLIDQLHDEGVDPARLDAVIADTDLLAEAARHWDRTLRFVDIVRRAWPGILAQEEGGASDPRARQRAVVENQLALWRTSPPDHPIIAAASTGSIGSTAELLAGIAALEHGAVVLPGLDPDTPEDIWNHAGPDHPLGPFRGLMQRCGRTPDTIPLWHGSGATTRAKWLSQALRPAPVTDHWHREAASLAALTETGAEGLALLVAADPAEEANAISLAMRDALETPGRTVALITPDASLARRVTAALARFEIRPDDTMGQPLLQTPPGVLLRMVAEIARGTTGAVEIAALLSHPLVQPGLSRAEHLRHARAYERRMLRGPVAPHTAMLPPWDDATPEGAAWHGAIDATLAELAAALNQGASLSTTLATHMAVLEALTTSGPDAKTMIWEDEAGDALHKFLTKLADAAGSYGDGPIPDYPALLSSLMSGEQLRPRPREPHPRVLLSGPREARLVSADLVILAGLEDGTWPAVPDPGPWLSRPMYQTLGLPMPERSVGLSAHDFLHAASGPEVILSRARKRDGAATVASRWLIRLETLAKGVGAEPAWDAMTARGQHWCQLARATALPDTPAPRAERPRPVPPLEARPRKLSVTALELLVRDAYAIYARDILKLRPVEPLGRPVDARDRGIVLHRILEEFVKTTDPWPGTGAAEAALISITEKLLADDVPWPDLRRIWQARVARAAPWFAAGEDVRRQAGTPVVFEASGTLMLDLPEGPFKLTAKADRIDRHHEGTGAIYDYKTGAPPTDKQIAAGFNHQLHVQAAMLAAGGFEGVGALDPASGAYLGLTGSAEGGKTTEMDLPMEAIAKHMAEVAELLAAYDAGAAYVSHGRPMKLSFTGDYDHLARKREWSDEDAT